MSRTMIMMIVLAVVVPVSGILRWKRDWIILRISPRAILLIGGTEETRRVYGSGTIPFLKYRNVSLALKRYNPSHVRSVSQMDATVLTPVLERPGETDLPELRIRFAWPRQSALPGMWGGLRCQEYRR